MKTTWLFPVLVAGTISGQAIAGEELGQAEIRELVRQGEILPLETILARLPAEKFGRLLDLEVEREQGTVVYEIEFLSADGRIVEVEVDARDGSVLQAEVDD